jgi:hypothetical protein
MTECKNMMSVSYDAVTSIASCLYVLNLWRAVIMITVSDVIMYTPLLFHLLYPSLIQLLTSNQAQPT